MNIKLFYSRNEPNNKWIAWGKNFIGDDIYNIIIFRDGYVRDQIKLYKQNSFTKRCLDENMNYFASETRNYSLLTKKLATDVYRNLTINEYFNLERLLKLTKLRYNKKKDEFFKVNR